MGTEIKSEVRLVCYPLVVGMEVKNVYGFFNVHMENGKAIRATPLNITRLSEIAVALDVGAQLWDTLFNDDTLLSLQTIDPDQEEWDGTLTF